MTLADLLPYLSALGALLGAAVGYGVLRNKVQQGEKERGELREELRDLHAQVNHHVAEGATVQADIASLKTSVEHILASLNRLIERMDK